MNNRERRVGTPRAPVILEYWQQNCIQLGPVKKGDDFGVEQSECFACGNFIHGLHRAHIVPLCFGGSNSVDNIHLLCPGCHCESENMTRYWTWLKYKRYNEWDYPIKHMERHLKIQGIDITQEAEYLSSINATRKQLEEHIENIYQRLRTKEIN